MIRVLIPLLLFLLPFAVYGIIIAMQRANANSRGETIDPNRTMHYGIAALIGLLLAGLSIAGFGLYVAKEDAAYYQPPTLGPDGRLTPGRLMTEEAPDLSPPATSDAD